MQMVYLSLRNKSSNFNLSTCSLIQSSIDTKYKREYLHTLKVIKDILVFGLDRLHRKNKLHRDVLWVVISPTVQPVLDFANARWLNVQTCVSIGILFVYLIIFIYCLNNLLCIIKACIYLIQFLLVHRLSIVIVGRASGDFVKPFN